MTQLAAGCMKTGLLPLKAREQLPVQQLIHSRRQLQESAKRLFAASGGKCAFPGCANPLHHESGALLAEIVHIRSISPGGPRYSPSLKGDVQNADNLILLCPTHHAVIDQAPECYGPKTLREMKADHERKIREIIDQSRSFEIGPVAARQLVRQIDPSAADFVVLTTLSVELAAVLKFFPTVVKTTNASFDSRQEYYQGFVTADDRLTRYRVVVATQDTNGQTSWAGAIAELIQVWNPRYLIVCGIAAGLRPEYQRLGDVVVSTEVSHHEQGKLSHSGTVPRQVSYRSDPLLLASVRQLCDDSIWRARLSNFSRDSLADQMWPAIHCGRLASGDKLLISSSEIDRLRKLDRGLQAVELEGAGSLAGAFANARDIGFLAVRAICDFGDGKKDDRWQFIAAESSASCVAQLIASRPIPPAGGDWTPQSDEIKTPESAYVRRVLFPRLCKSLDMEQLKDFCFVLEVEIDDLRATTKHGKIRELLTRVEKHGQLSDILKAFQELLDSGSDSDGSGIRV